MTAVECSDIGRRAATRGVAHRSVSTGSFCVIRSRLFDGTSRAALAHMRFRWFSRVASVSFAPLLVVAACGDDSTSGGGGNASTGSAATLPQAGSTSIASGSSSGGAGGGQSFEGTVIGEFTGVNANIADKIENLAPLGWVREYHNWGWIADNYATGPAYPDMKYTFMNFNGWDWDVYFADLEAQGGHAFPAVQGGVPWMNGGNLPPFSGGDKTAAEGYIAHGDAMFQIAARYGSATVADEKLELKDSQTRVSGLGTVKYFENFNEQDNASEFTPDAFAAMSSADMDGDQNRLGDTIGIKNADPNAKLVMGGLSGKYPTTNWVQSITDYLDGMQAWADAHRGGDFPADVINVHLYSFGPGNGQPAPSPEADHIKDKLSAITAYRDQHLPGKPLWWTEFGYDSFSGSSLGTPTLGANSPFIVQGQWLVRDFLAALASGYDRATLFEIGDTCKLSDPNCHPDGAFVTCGLIDGDGNKKPAWYFVAAFRARLATMVYTDEQSSGDPDVMVYRFKDTVAAGGALVVWAPTSEAKVVGGYALALPGGATTAKAVTLADQQANGVESELTPAGGKVSIDVSETPTIVLVDSM